MSPRVILLLSLAFILQQGSSRASNDTDDAEKCLKASVDEVVQVAKKASDRKALALGVKPILAKILSFEVMTRRAVGPGWRLFTPDQQSEAIGLFTTLIIRTYTAKFTPGELPVITYKPASSPAPGRVEAPTSILFNGSNYDVIYRLEQAQGWRITDVVIEGVSMIANYRSQFDARFKEGGATAVINSLTGAVAAPR